MSAEHPPAIWEELYGSLDSRWRPEDVAQILLVALRPLPEALAEALLKAAPGARHVRWSSMRHDFQRPKSLDRELALTELLFGEALPGDTLRDRLAAAQARLGNPTGQRDYRHGRLNRGARQRIGLTLSRRRYDKLFRLLARLAEKLDRRERALRRRLFMQVAKSRLACRITNAEFHRDETLNTAAFLVYFTARLNRRSVFTNQAQDRPYDAVADLLFQRCQQSPLTNWSAIARVYPHPKVMAHLSESEQGELLGMWYTLLRELAGELRVVWERSNIDRASMVVRRGNDSSSWNLLAGAWNKAREGWVSTAQAMGLETMLDGFCPGKVLRLMASDVSAWHSASGGKLEPDTAVWNELPLPWESFAGCPRALVEAVCRKHGVDPVAKGWSAARSGQMVADYRPTPELVHGVAISSPELALKMRRAGWFSGKPARLPGEAIAVEVVRDAHGAAAFAREVEAAPR